MRLKILHSTRYEYDAPVRLLTHLAYLRPRDGARVHVPRFEMRTSPPASTLWMDDDLGNRCARLEFSDTSSSLEVAVESLVETSDSSPFQFLVRDYAIELPFSYEILHASNLAPGRAPLHPDAQRAVTEFLRQTFANPPTNTVQWLFQLAQLFPQSFRYEHRIQEGIRSAQETLSWGSGSCRDLSNLYIACLRHVGIASRFVSGYHFLEGFSEGGGEMHAWVEAYLPGAGWLAIDPTHGMFCDAAYVPVAHAYIAESVNPLQGSWLGPGHVSSRLSTTLVIEKLTSGQSFP